MEYKEKLRLAKEALDSGSYDKETIEYIFPELKESEGDRIKTFLHHTFTAQYLCKDKLGKWHGEPVVNILSWLEKQGEQKPAKNILEAWKDMRLEVYQQASGNRHEPNCSDDTTKMFSLNDIDEIVEKMSEQKPANKIEHKFHEGDWIVHHGTENIYQVVAIIDNQYQLKYGDTYTIQNCTDVDRCARLWDVTKDAKDGDVLCSENGWTCIFKALDNHTNTFSSYCFMDSYKWFCNTGSECHTLDKVFIKAYNGEIYPATKEQRDTLIKAMADEGYTFDFEKKELKKIEQKSVEWNKNDEVLLDETLHFIREFQQSDRCIDEGNMQNSVTCENWFKSLRPQSTWKPSDEQMKALKEAVDEHFDIDGGALWHLYEDLKKLREE